MAAIPWRPSFVTWAQFPGSPLLVGSKGVARVLSELSSQPAPAELDNAAVTYDHRLALENSFAIKRDNINVDESDRLRFCVLRRDFR